MSGRRTASIGAILDAYLALAEEILRIERRPLSARAILAAAYRLDKVPSHLYGRTQHKTLGARISENIIAERDRSLFFRTKPGRYFLREFLDDESVAEEHRSPIATRRRVRDLVRGPALAFDESDLKGIGDVGTAIDPEKVLDLLRNNRFRYDDPRQKSPGTVFLWSFVAVCRDREILSYRLGRYRDDRDTFLSRRCIGFSNLVHIQERTLFNEDYGIVDSGLIATKLDLDIPETKSEQGRERMSAALRCFIRVPRENNDVDLLAVISFECPRWFHPERRRLALNDLHWLDLRVSHNDIDDFDPWSKSVLLNKSFALEIG